MKMGAMVAYQGDVQYTRENLLQKGWGRLLKRTATGEGTELTKAEGNGTVYLADRGKKITMLRLDDDALYVNGNDVLALEWQIDWDVRLMKRVSAMLAGGLFNMHLSGSGLIAITTHYDPLTLEVTPGRPVFTDPNATVAWSASLDPTFRTDVSFKTFLGRGGGESLQMQFEGNGFVVVQPYEEYYGSVKPHRAVRDRRRRARVDYPVHRRDRHRGHDMVGRRLATPLRSPVMRHSQRDSRRHNDVLHRGPT